MPEFDHLYLDMNGIIHGCTHPHDRDISDVLSEREMMLGIMHYLDRIINIVKPKVSIYMAIDGVAPRAKLNQQRSRRFRSAKDMAEATADMESRVDDLFDSNCITPGTEFLNKVSEFIQYFIRKKIKEDPHWHSLNIIFSGADIPGEGEHKIMEHIREMRASPRYQPNNRHCIYGQDADLIMLGLVTHEPHFTILREVVNFNSFGDKNALKQVKKFTKESDFQLLHLSVLREYLQIEFAYQQPQYDLERLIDDFVFMTFLVGNDFLPHMPTLDIGDGAFDLLFGIYKDQREFWGNGQYLVENGDICNPSRLEGFLAAIGMVETDILTQREKDDAEYTKKKRRWDKRDGVAGGPSDAEIKQHEAEKQSDYMSMIEDLLSAHDANDFVDGWTPVSEAGQKDYKGRYYFEKLKMTPVDKDDHWKLRCAYIEGLRWCLAYYYRGCISWSWFYPYHYGPMLSDLTNIPKMFEITEFKINAPLTPFQQLMGCLPPASSQLVPQVYRWLMTSPQSPIIHFYPTEFEVDMNGKRNPWEGVNLLPFIEIEKLREAIATHCPDAKLSEAERKRNRVGEIFCYKYDNTCADTVESPGRSIGMADITKSHSSVATMDPKLGLSNLVFEPKLVEGTQLPYPGFPSLMVLPLASVELTPVGVNCFGTPSKYPNTILTMYQMPELPPIEQLADTVLGKSLFVNWPMMHEAKVVGVSSSSKEIKLVKGKKKKFEYSKFASDKWHSDSAAMSQMYYTGNGTPGTGGLQIGEVHLRLKVLPLQGMKTNPANGSKKKMFGKEEADVPLQLALWQAPAPDPRFVERGPMTLRDRFPEKSQVVLTKGKYRGCTGTVVGVVDEKNVGVKVETFPPETPFGLAIARSVQESYLSSADAARVLKVNPSVLGKVMGRLQFQQGRYDLGLNLKSADGMCVVGYTRKKVDQTSQAAKKQDKAWSAGDAVLVVGSRSVTPMDEEAEERIQWEYTPKAIRLFETYRNKFPKLFAAISRNPNERKYDANDVFGKQGEAWLPVVREWLDNNESAKIPRFPTSTESMAFEAAAAVQKAADVRTLALKKKGYPKETMLKIPGSALYREGSTGATDVLLAGDLNNDERPQLGDRIVNLCADGVPFGARGTVIGIHEAETTGSVEVVMDEEFIGGTSLQGHCANFRGKLCLWSHLLKIAVESGDGAAATTASTKQTQPSAPNVTKILSKKDKTDSSKATPVRGNKSAATPPRSKSRTGSASRATSTGRNKQVLWKEARGPDEKGTGFKGAKRGGSTGLKRWKKIISSKPTTNAASVDQTANDLKRILGVSTGMSQQKPVRSIDPEAKLKSILGVSGGPQTKNGPTQPKTSAPVSDAEGLKSILGVSSPPESTGTSTLAKASPAPSSAADKLLAMMAGKQPQAPPTAPSPQVSSFNFTYVEEGKEVPPPPPPTMPVYPSYPPQPLGVPPIPHGMMPQMPYGMPPMANVPTPNFGVHGGQAPQFAFHPAPPISHSEFPALGEEPAPEPKEKQPKAPNLLVPSAVASKGQH